MDYEAEFAFVIGKEGRNIPKDDWEDYVFGYTIVNDVSARDYQLATSQWTIGKTFDTFGPMGAVDRKQGTRSPIRTTCASVWI